jgi:Laminin G domain
VKQRLVGSAVGAALVLAALLFGAPAHAAAEQIRLNFDAAPIGQPPAGPWTTGCFADAAAPADNACIGVAAGGSVARVQRPSGTTTSPAIGFPASGTAKAVLTVPHAAYLNPGTADFTVSAIVNLTAAERSPGANIVQKGVFNTAGGQWKLQVDNGVPSCRIAGGRSGVAVSAIVAWGSSIADQGWKFVQCKRRGAVLSISVANATAVNSPDDASMDISNTAKVTVGAKGTGTSNDQFHGALDNVIFSVG